MVLLETVLVYYKPFVKHLKMFIYSLNSSNKLFALLFIFKRIFYSIVKNL